MPPARRLAFTALLAPLALVLATPSVAQADVGATVSLQSEARERGVSYSASRPGAQLGLAWDGSAGWYGGASLAHARFDAERHGTWLRVYGGRVVALRPGLDGEAGLLLHRFDQLSRYDFTEAYVGLLGERWNLRLHHAPSYYGSGQGGTYGEANLRWPLRERVSALGHVGVLAAHGTSRWATYRTTMHGPTRIDLRAGASWLMGEHVEVQLAWVSVSRGGPPTWADTARRRTVVLGVSAAL